MILQALVVSHLVALGVGVFLLRQIWWRPIPVLLVAWIPVLLLSIWQLHDAWYLRDRAVYDRFRDYIVDPIPASVTDLRFIGLDEAHSLHLMLRFTISPEDLADIIRSKGFTQISASQFRQPDDLFTHPEYLPLAEPATYYIINDIKAGYPDKGVGVGYTLKVSADRKHVIFRREDAAYYLYRYWESDNERGMAKEFFDSIGQHTASKTADSAKSSRGP